MIERFFRKIQHSKKKSIVTIALPIEFSSI